MRLGRGLAARLLLRAGQRRITPESWVHEPSLRCLQHPPSSGLTPAWKSTGPGYSTLLLLLCLVWGCSSHCPGRVRVIHTRSWLDTRSVSKHGLPPLQRIGAHSMCWGAPRVWINVLGWVWVGQLSCRRGQASLKGGSCGFDCRVSF